MTAITSVAARALERRGRSGVAWSVPHGGDLDANVVVVRAGDTIGEHVNDEVDVLLVGVAGRGTVIVDGESLMLSAGTVMLVPKHTARSIVAGAGETVVYVTVHRARAGLRIERRR